MRSVLALAMLAGMAMGVAGCEPKGTPPTASLAAPATDAKIAAAAATAAPAIAASIPGASPTLVKDAACASPVIASMANAVADAPAGSSAEQQAVAALTDGLVTWLAEGGQGCPSAP